MLRRSNIPGELTPIHSGGIFCLSEISSVSYFKPFKGKYISPTKIRESCRNVHIYSSLGDTFCHGPNTKCLWKYMHILFPCFSSFCPALGGAVPSGYQSFSDQSPICWEAAECGNALEDMQRGVVGLPPPTGSAPHSPLPTGVWVKSLPELYPLQDGLSGEKGVWEPASHCPCVTGTSLSLKATP